MTGWKKNLTAENSIIQLPTDFSKGTKNLKSRVEFLKELTHIARKEKESAESNRMNRALFRLQIIMAISLFTSAAALFSVSINQIESNWLVVVIMLAFSAVLTWGTYYFIRRS